jgi:hypothetical protein
MFFKIKIRQISKPYTIGLISFQAGYIQFRVKELLQREVHFNADTLQCDRWFVRKYFYYGLEITMN